MPDKRILLIEDETDYVRLVNRVLGTGEQTFEVQSAPDLAAGLASLKEHLPELVLVDLSLPDSSGYETFLRVQERAQGIPVIVLTGLDDDQVAEHAVEDGAADYLVKSLIQPKIILRSVHMAFSRQRRQVLPKDGLSGVSGDDVLGSVLSFIGSKGGVGTSTTAVNIAALLALNGFETVVIELQQGRPGTLSLYSQTDPAHGLNSLLEKPADTITPSDVQECLVEARRGLRLLCPTAGATPGRWPALDADHVHAIITAARRVGRFVVLDLPAHLDGGVWEALKLSDSVTMIVDREAASVHSGAAFQEQIRLAVSRETQVRLAVVDRTGLEVPLALDDIEKQFKVHPSAIIPQAGAAIALSHSAGIPLVLLYPGAAYSLSHFELAEQLLPKSVASSHRPPAPQLTHNVSWEVVPETTYS